MTGCRSLAKENVAVVGITSRFPKPPSVSVWETIPPGEADSGRRIITVQTRDEYFTFLMLNDLTVAPALSEKMFSFRL